MTSNCGYAALLRINAAIGAVSEAGLGHTAHAAYDARLTYARDHLASREAWLERDIRCAIIAIGVEINAVLCTFFGIVCAESEQLAACNRCRSVRIDHAAHTAVHAAFHDDDAAGMLSGCPPHTSAAASQTVQFEPVDLSKVATDPDNKPAELKWSVSGNKDLKVEVKGSRAMVVTPNPNWNGNPEIPYLRRRWSRSRWRCP